MLGDLKRELAHITTRPILNWRDADGYPASARVSIELTDDFARIEVPAGIEANAGPASLMKHSFNERLWDLKSVLFRGELTREGDEWRFRPTKQVGKAKQGLRDMFRFMGQCGKTATTYLAKRNLERPKIPWASIKRMQKRAKQLGID